MISFSDGTQSPFTSIASTCKAPNWSRAIGASPAPDVTADLPDRCQRVLDDIGAGQRAPEFPRPAEADDGDHF